MNDASSKARVLVIDDDSSAVRAVAHHLRREYTVVGVYSASEAFEALATSEFSAILCDQRLPDLPGDRLVAQVRELHPKVMRLMMTASSDPAALASAVNHGQIFAYLRKPFAHEELDQVLGRAIAYQRLLSENERVREDLESSNLRLGRANAELRSFSHAVAHDLQEPLRTLSAYAQFLEDELGTTLSGEASHYLSGISRCSGHLRRLIDDLQRLSELDHVAVTFRPMDLGQVMNDARQLLEASIAERRAEVIVASGLPKVVGDPERMVLLFQNLIANGLKFNRAAIPRVTVSPIAAPLGQIGVAVSDNGIGIEPEYRDRIFDLFQRLHSKAEYPGTGAGLAIVRRVAESHGGSVGVFSRDGAGSEFRVYLPAEPPHPQV